MTYPPQPGGPGDPSQGGQYPYGGQPGQPGGPPSGGFPPPGQPQPGQPQPGQPYPGQPYPGQPYPGQPQPGGFPQQGGQPGGYQQYGYPQQGFAPQDPYGGGPKKSKTGLLVGLGGGGVVLAAFLITGLVAPGFLLPDGPGDVADDFVSAMNDKDAQAVNGLTCEPEDDLGDPFGESGELQDVEFTIEVTGDAVEKGDAKATVPIKNTRTVAGTTLENEADLVIKDEDGWCIDDLEAKPGSGGNSELPSTEPTGGYGDYGDYGADDGYDESYPTDEYDEDYGY